MSKSEISRFLTRTLTLALLPLIGCVVLLVIPADMSYNYSYTYENCLGQGRWIYKSLYEDTGVVDIAFVGSSHTICAVNDSLMQYQLSHESNKVVHVVNLGYCRLGRNLHYSFIDQLVKTRQPRAIVLEVSETENRSGHPEFGFFARTEDVLDPVFLFNGNVLKDLYDAVYVRFFRFREMVTGLKREHDELVRGYGYMNSSEVADPIVLTRYKEDNRDRYRIDNKVLHDYYYRYSKKYIERISKLAVQNDCNLFFLCLPSYGGPLKPAEYIFYNEMGTVLRPPSNIYADAENWKDPNHFNHKGASAITEWLSDTLAEHIY